MASPATAPGLLNLPDIYRGCDWLPVVIRWKDPSGNPYDLTSWTPFAETTGGTNLNPVVNQPPSAGVTQLSLSAAQTATLKLGVEKWDWIWWNAPPFGFKFPPLLAGQVTIREPVTEDFPGVVSGAPPNDLFGFAQLLQGQVSDPSTPVVGTTVLATTELYEPNPPAVNTVWYVWAGVFNGHTNVWTRRDFFIDVYSGPDIVSLTYIGTSSDNGTVSILTFTTAQNVQYYFRVRPPDVSSAAAFSLGWNNVPNPPM
jgi:hypothetical protein